MTFIIDKGSILPAYQRTLLDENQDPVDLTGVSSLTLQLKRVGEITTVTRTAEIVNAPIGKVKYEWQTADTLTPGDFEAVWVADGVKYPAGSYELVRVFEDDSVSPSALIFCTVAEARTLIRQDLDIDELALAQTTIAVRCGLDTTNTDQYAGLTDQDKLGLKQATAFQARWLRSQFDFLDRMNLSSESADGESRNYTGSSMMLAPWAEWALANTSFSAFLGSTINTPRSGIEEAYEVYRGSNPIDERTWGKW